MKQDTTIARKITSMTAKEIILAMVEGLRNPITKIDMGTYGEVREGICYGCAATNTLCNIGGYTQEDLLDAGGRASKLSLNFPEIVRYFESAIDDLRRDDIAGYNHTARHAGFALINSPDFELPILTDSFTEDDLKLYEKLANMQ